MTLDPHPAGTAGSVPAIPPAARRGRWLRTLVIGALLLLVALAVIALAIAAAWDRSYDGRVLPGVHAGSTDLGGMTHDQAAAAISAAYPYDRGELVLRTPAGDIALSYAAAGRRVDVDAMVTEALAAGRGDDFPFRLVKALRVALDGAAVEPRMLLDEAALATAIRAAAEPLALPPVDAGVSMGPAGPVRTVALWGRAVNTDPVVAQAVAALGAMDAPSRIVIPVGVSRVRPSITDEAVLAGIRRMRSMVKTVTLVYGRKTWHIPAAVVRSWITFSTADGVVRPVVDTTLIPEHLARTAKAVARPAANAIFLRNRSGRIVGVGAAEEGRTLDPEGTSLRVAAELLSRTLGGPATPVTLAWSPVAPRLGTDEAAMTAPVMAKLGTWTTWFPISERNYWGANIWIPARLISGTVLAPGQTFDWWSAVGPVTADRGFGPGGVIRGSYTDPTGALGGGMCSSSTTLFNAALRAGLRMGARDNHKYYISRYPLGLDATVWIIRGHAQSMTFTNDTGKPILVRGVKSRRGGIGYVTYEIWGTDDGRTTTISRPRVSNVVAATTNTVYVDTLPHGERLQLEYPSNAMDVAVTRTVRDANGKILHLEVWETHYIRWNGLIQVGR